MNKFREFQEVAHRDHPNPRPVRPTPPAAPAVNSREESPLRTARDLSFFLCMASLMILALNGLRGMLP